MASIVSLLIKIQLISAKGDRISAGGAQRIAVLCLLFCHIYNSCWPINWETGIGTETWTFKFCSKLWSTSGILRQLQWREPNEYIKYWWVSKQWHGLDFLSTFLFFYLSADTYFYCLQQSNFCYVGALHHSQLCLLILLLPFAALYL